MAPACTADTTSSTNFNFDCTALSSSAYTLRATGKGPMQGVGYTDKGNVALCYCGVAIASSRLL